MEIMKETEKQRQSQPPTETLAGSILVAEDSPIYRRLIGTHLKEWGFDYLCVKDGREAWKLLMKGDAPRLALLDWVLPEIDALIFAVAFVSGRGRLPIPTRSC
jgi:CheY-like chemotaxis protein